MEADSERDQEDRLQARGVYSAVRKTYGARFGLQLQKVQMFVSWKSGWAVPH